MLYKQIITIVGISWALHSPIQHIRGVMVWLNGNAFVSINIVTLHWAWLVLGWVTVYGHVAIQLVQLSLLTGVGR